MFCLYLGWKASNHALLLSLLNGTVNNFYHNLNKDQPTYCSYFQSREDLNLYQPWKFPSLVSLSLHPQRGKCNLLRVPQTRASASRSPSLPLIKNRITSRNKSNFLSTRSDSEPTICLSLTPQSTRRPSIVLTKASVEQEGRWYGSIGSRLPSHLSLGSSYLNPTPAPTTPMSLCFNDKSFPPNRSVTPLLFPEHQLNMPTSISLTPSRTSQYLSPTPYHSAMNVSTQHAKQRRAISKSQLNLRGRMTNFLSPSASNWSLSARGSSTNIIKQIPTTRHCTPLIPTIITPSMYIAPTMEDMRERKVMTGFINVWTKQASLETRV